jgi:hypothetical protein
MISEPSTPLPDHTQLPESDGTFVKNFEDYCFAPIECSRSL